MLSLGVIGAGDIARKVHLPVLLNTPDVRVSWVYDLNPERTSAVARANGIRAVEPCLPTDLPQCDVALIAIPVGARGAYYDSLAQSKTAVFAEKPFAVSVAEHHAISARFEPYRLACGYMRRFYSSTRLLRGLVRTRPFGRLVRMKISEGNRLTGSRVDKSYLDDSRQSSSGGILSELGCHSLDAAIFITDAHAYQTEACHFVFDGRVDRKISATIKLSESPYLPEAGVSLDFCVSWLDRQENAMTLEFENTSIWCELRPGGEVLMGDPSQPAAATLLTPAVQAARTSNQAFFLQWRSFLQGLLTGTESEISARSTLLGTELIEDLYERGRRNA